MANRVSANQREYLEHIHRTWINGVCTADVVRACKRNPRAGHRWIYDSVQRLIRRGFVRVDVSQADRRRGLLSLTDSGRAALGEVAS